MAQIDVAPPHPYTAATWQARKSWWLVPAVAVGSASWGTLIYGLLT